MRSSFFGLNVATQGLYTSLTALDVTNHNISNAETKGYSKQYAMIQASRPLPDSYRGMVGTGAEVIGIMQSRSSYIDSKYWSMSTDLGQHKIKNELLGQIESIFNEPSDTGYNELMADLFAKLSTLSTAPPESAIVSNFIDAADSFTKYFNNLSEQFADYQRDADFGVKSSVTQINFLAGQLASVNNQIGNLELGGASANDLRDERVRLIDQLSQIINIDAKEYTDINGKKKFVVSINGQNLVDGNATNYLEVVARKTFNNPEDQPSLHDIQWKTGKKLYLNNANASGSLKGYLDIRDGNNGENFKGQILSVDTTDPLNHKFTVQASRHDIPSAGEITINNQVINYKAISYNDTTKEMTFTWTPPVAPAPVPTVAAGASASIGETVNYKGIPYYTMKLNEFVRTMAKEFNRMHKMGDGGNDTELFVFEGYTGTPALSETGEFSSYDQINIANFSFSKAVMADNGLLQNSKTKGAGESANDLFFDMMNIKQDTKLFKKGKPDSFMQALIGEIGIDVKKSNSFEKAQANLTKLINNQRLSISSVDINEETADMLKFQQAYSLSAKMISVMDEIYNVTINQLVR